MVSSFEPVEARILFICSELSGDVLRVVGTGGSDTILVQPFVVAPNELVRVTDNGRVRDFPADRVRSIVIEAGGGHDTVTVETDRFPTTINGGKGNDTINGGFAADVIHGGKGNDLIRAHEGNDVIRGGKGNDTISGGTGNDEMLGQQGDDVFDAVDVDLGRDTVGGGGGNDTASVDDSDLGNDVLPFDDVETVNVP
jgi:Ca2+-binding RTX toxin-like protein